MSEEFTLEALHGMETDPESEKKVSQSTQLPVGFYNSVPELTLTLFKSKPEAKYPGRAYAKLFGKFKASTTQKPADQEALGKEGMTGLMLSWEPRYKEDGKADLSTRLFKNASDTYRRAMNLPDHAVVEVRAIIEYIQKYSIGVRFGQGDEDNIAFSISNAKE